MQPSFRGRRRIGRELRPDPPLAYERLGDPILVQRASDASGLPVGTAKCYAHRGRAGLRAHLEGDSAALAARESGAVA